MESVEQDDIIEALTRRGAMIAAAGFWAVGLIVGTLGIWRVSAPEDFVGHLTGTSRGVTEAMPVDCDRTDQASDPSVASVDMSNVTGAMVFPEDTLVAAPSGVTEIQVRPIEIR